MVLYFDGFHPSLMIIAFRANGWMELTAKGAKGMKEN
jgi:hypothetical protein